MTDFDMYVAKTQARLTYFLITILVVLTMMLLSIMLFPSMRPQSEITNLLVQVVTGVLALCGSAVAFFFARHRPPTKGDEDSVSNKPPPEPAPSPLVSTQPQPKEKPV